MLELEALLLEVVVVLVVAVASGSGSFVPFATTSVTGCAVISSENTSVLLTFPLTTMLSPVTIFAPSLPSVVTFVSPFSSSSVSTVFVSWAIACFATTGCFTTISK